MKTKKQVQQSIFRWSKRISKWLFFAVLAYVTILLIGLVPVNNDFRPTQDGIKLYLSSTAVHSDVIVPVNNSVVNWADRFRNANFLGDITDQTHVSFGWGDRGFFLETRTWDDLKLSVAANAILLPSRSCVHVSYMRPEYYSNLKSVTVSKKQYERLVGFIDKTMRKDSDQQYLQIKGYAYSSNDAFFEALGRYHLFNTCNSWVGRALRETGVRAPWLSPMPKTPLLYIETDEIAKSLD